VQVGVVLVWGGVYLGLAAWIERLWARRPNAGGESA